MPGSPYRSLFNSFSERIKVEATALDSAPMNLFSTSSKWILWTIAIVVLVCVVLYTVLAD